MCIRDRSYGRAAVAGVLSSDHGQLTCSPRRDLAQRDGEPSPRAPLVAAGAAAERFLDKALYEISFAALSAPRVLARMRRADVVVCVVPSLLAASIAATVRRRVRLVLWVQDLVGLAARSVADSRRGSRRREPARAICGCPSRPDRRL